MNSLRSFGNTEVRKHAKFCTHLSRKYGYLKNCPTNGKRLWWFPSIKRVTEKTVQTTGESRYFAQPTKYSRISYCIGYYRCRRKSLGNINAASDPIAALPTRFSHYGRYWKRNANIIARSIICSSTSGKLMIAFTVTASIISWLNSVFQGS